MSFVPYEVVVLVATIGPAAEPSGRGGHADSVAVAVRSEPPRVDGHLNDSVWAHAIPVTTFVQRDPIEGAPATYGTSVRILYSDDALYVGIRADDPQPERLMAPLARRDSRPPGDWVGIMIDSHYDRRTAFEFAVNPAGVRRDVFRFNDFEEDVSWDAVWDVATTRDARGWSAEFRIPLSQLRYSHRAGLRFGFNAYREVGRNNEVQYWKLLPKQERGVVSRFGDLVGLDGLSGSRRVEIAPYFAGRTSLGNRSRARYNASAGADLRVALTPGTSLSAAINPDFGQVEGDPAVVNLSSLELAFPERRPLFVQGADLFRLPLTPDSTASETLLYTRRIGRAPQLAAAYGADDAGADAVTILAATKLVGRMASGWSFGVLGAATAAERAAANTDAGPTTVEIEPRAEQIAARISRELNEGRSLVGAFGTILTRHPDSAASPLRKTARTAGLSLSHRPGDGPYLARAQVVASHVAGSAQAIAATQQSSVHYFQRPDARYAQLDTTSTSLSGAAMWVDLARDRGATVGHVRFWSRSPGFEVNDLGFVSEAGRHTVRSFLSRRWLERTRFRRASIDVETFWNADWSGRVIARGAGVRGSVTLPSYLIGSAEAWRNFGGADPVALRGGPALARRGNDFYRIDFGSDPRQAFRAAVTLVERPFDDGSRETRGNATLGIRPSSRVDLELTPSLERHRLLQQYVGTATGFDPHRYVVGRLHQSIARIGLRLSVAFSPDITFQGYTESFATSGEYRALYEVIDASARATGRRLATLPAHAVETEGDTLTVDLDGDTRPDLVTARPDFAVVSHRSTGVLRWEVRPGSVVSFVVQHDGRDTSPFAGKHALSELGRVASLASRTVMLLKVAYWSSW